MAVILSVEDSRINQMMLTERLQMRGYEVIQAFDGEEALEAIKSDKTINLVLLDIGLPKKDGLEVAKEVVESGKFNGLPIMFLTAHATVEYRDKAAQLGISDFFTKPIDFKALFLRIEKILESTNSH